MPSDHTYEERSTLPPEAASCDGVADSDGRRVSAPFPPHAATPGGATRQAALIRTFEAQIIPRLLLACRNTAEPLARDEHSAMSQAHTDAAVAELTRLVLHHPSDVAAAYVQMIHDEGASLEHLLLRVLTPVARRIGKGWEDDTVDFFAVSIALARLQTIVRDLSLASSTEHLPARSSGKILLVPEVGEQHTFGLQLVGEFFRRARWTVREAQPATPEEYVELVSGEYFDVVGVSVGSDSRLEHLAARITLTRRVSRNRGVCVLVGGPIVLLRPELVRKLGADASAADGAEAVQVAQKFVRAGAAASRPYS